jgi:hypothetical protein
VGGSGLVLDLGKQIGVARQQPLAAAVLGAVCRGWRRGIRDGDPVFQSDDKFKTSKRKADRGWNAKDRTKNLYHQHGGSRGRARRPLGARRRFGPRIRSSSSCRCKLAQADSVKYARLVKELNIRTN